MARVLFVDDDQVTLNMLSKVAELEGHEVLKATTGGVVLQQALEGKPDIIFLDMMMPDVDGFSALKILRDHPETAAIPVIILSAGLDLDASDRVEAAGAQAYYTKPISINILREVIRAYT